MSNVHRIPEAVQRLEVERVVSIKVIDGVIEFKELCDGNFTEAFTPNEVREIANHLLLLANLAEQG